MRLSAPSGQSFELTEAPRMDRIKKIFQPEPAYRSLDAENEDEEYEARSPTISESGEEEPMFSWLEYSVFLLLGVAMLWAWNMFMAAAPYFQRRFAGNDWILNHFQPAEISVSTVANLGSMLVLSNLQKNASYPKRISWALVITLISFALLALSTLVQMSPSVYFGLLLAVVAMSSTGTGLIQNGVFAYASGFGQPRYVQAIMTGQGIAGVLPPLVQIISVISVPIKRPEDVDGAAESPKAALVYFLTAVAVSVVSLMAFIYLLRQTARSQAVNTLAKVTSRGISEGDAVTDDLLSAEAEKVSVPLMHLFRKLPFLATAVLLCFAVTMVFPVFTASIFSVSGIDAAVFIPLAFLSWNVGDLLGRLITIFPKVSLTHYPFALFSLSMARLIFIPMYLLCNIKSRGAFINSDIFYLIVVQLLFGLSNGYLGSQCMMGASDWVLPEEREAAGAFMGLMLVGGLTIGSLLSFLLGDI